MAACWYTAKPIRSCGAAATSRQRTQFYQSYETGQPADRSFCMGEQEIGGNHSVSSRRCGRLQPASKRNQRVRSNDFRSGVGRGDRSVCRTSHRRVLGACVGGAANLVATCHGEPGRRWIAARLWPHARWWAGDLGVALQRTPHGRIVWKGRSEICRIHVLCQFRRGLVPRTYQIETYLAQTLISQATQSETGLTLSRAGADWIRVAPISSDGRVGEWGSIPLLRA